LNEYPIVIKISFFCLHSPLFCIYCLPLNFIDVLQCKLNTIIGISILLAFLVGVGSYIMIKGKVENFCIAGKTLPSWIIAITMSGGAIDSNVLLGNVDLSYKYSWWDGAVLPLGIAVFLFINTFTLAGKMNAEPHAITLPDVIGNRFGKLVETLCSLACIASFIMLLAGTLVGMGFIISYVWDTKLAIGIWISGGVVWSYTFVGGLFSVVSTDVAQGALGL
jgi:Na+/proline symporter